MGSKHSKPRIRRSRRLSSIRKREAPEGSTDPSPPPKETYKGDAVGSVKSSHGHDDACKFCCVRDDHCDSLSRIKRQAEACDNRGKDHAVHIENDERYPSDYPVAMGLKVNLPHRDNTECCTRWGEREKSKTLPVSSTLPHSNQSIMEKCDEREWTITLYEIDKTSTEVPREDMNALMSSIYEAVNEKVGSSPQCRQTVRVRLSVTPERTAHTTLQRFDSQTKKDRIGCQCPNCPRTEPTSRKGFNDSKTRLRLTDTFSPLRSASNHVTSTTQDPHRTTRGYSSENSTGRKQQPNAINTEKDADSRSKHTPTTGPRQHFERTKSLPQSRRQPWTKSDEQRLSHTKSARHRRNNRDHRNVSSAGRKKEPKFASPYDQHFQEAMYLRLRELQRQGAFERRRAVGTRDSDEADDDSDYDVSNDKSIRQEVCKSTIQQTNSGTSKPCDDTNTPNDSQVHSSHVETVHHHHIIYQHGTTESNDQLPVRCVQNAIRTMSEVDDQQKSMGRGNQIHYHHYHLREADAT